MFVILEILFALVELIVNSMELRSKHPTWFGLSAQRKSTLDAQIKHSERLQQLLQEKQRRQAIQLYREETDASKGEARIAVHMIANSILADGSEALLVERSTTVLTEIRTLLQKGQKRKALQVYRTTTGTGLLQGAEAVNALELQWGLQQRM